MTAGASAGAVIRVDPYQVADRQEVLSLARSEGLELDPTAEAQRKHALFWVVRRLPMQAVRGYLLAWQVADELELLQLVVGGAVRRQGLGGALLDQLLFHGPLLGVGAIHLEVRASNGAALALYQSRGFVEQGQRAGYYANGEDALLLSVRVR